MIGINSTDDETVAAEPKSADQAGSEKETSSRQGGQNAFNVLMTTSKRKASGELQKRPKPAHKGGLLNKTDAKDALLNYIADPASFSSKQVIYYDDDFVAINDAFPKGSVHTLLLPRDRKRAEEHPLSALQDPEFLASIRNEVLKLKKLVASELRRRYGKFSIAEKARNEAMEADQLPEELPLGRDWEKDIEIGVHAGPSMNHLHIHVLSKEYISNYGRSGRHYQTFKSPFFVRLDEFPLADAEARLASRAKDLAGDMICWRCQKNFGRKWKSLEDHLSEEFEEWKKE